jgi:hypothetical protein
MKTGCRVLLAESSEKSCSPKWDDFPMMMVMMMMMMMMMMITQVL